MGQAAALLATLLGQDLDTGEGGVFRIARRVAPDRVISTVDPQARHGHKTSSRGFDGYKGHAAVDPDSEIITATTVTPGNVGDASAAEDLITDLLDDEPASSDEASTAGQATEPAGPAGDAADEHEAATVYGDAAYGSGQFQQRLAEAGIESRCKTQPPTPPPGGRFGKNRFGIDLREQTVSCPGGVTTPIRPRAQGGGTAYFGQACLSCPLRSQCSTATGGRTVHIGAHEQTLARARARQTDPAWQADYRATRPKVERKLGHLMRRKHGGRRGRVRGTIRVDADFRLLAAAANLGRLAVLGLRFTPGGWAVTPA